MKAIINNKRYNTETAIEIAQHWNGLGENDFNYRSESLYKTPKGQYFLHGSGGAFTEYSEQHGDLVYGGSRITPMTKQEASEWLELHQKVEAIESEFGSSIADA